MKKISKLFLFGSLLLIFLTTACGTNRNATPTLSGTSIVETSTPFLGLGTSAAGTASVLTTETPGTATTGSETPTASSTPSVSTQVTTVTGATATQNAAIPVTGSDITLVDCQFCVDNLAHALLVLPDVSTFQVISPTPSANTTAPISCSTIEVNNGKQVVLCSGPASTPVVLNICTNGSCTNFPVNLQACPLVQQQQATSAPGNAQATSTPIPAGAAATATPTTAAGNTSTITPPAASTPTP